MPVEIATVEPKPVERISEFVGTIKSRRSTTIQPQVDGIIRRIAVASGARVTPGAVLLEIDAERQQASVATLQSQRAARQHRTPRAPERAKTLLDAGAAPRWNSTARRARRLPGAAEGRRRGSGSSRSSSAYRVTPPTAGVVGDIPVRVGDRVTRRRCSPP
jgi:multidrug efflux pump subunit AcrA (membrane-fusion protein)